MSAADPNLEILRRVAVRLGDLRERLVLVGGAAVGLLITDPAAEAVRPTDDVDLIVELASRSEYRTGLREELLGLGFKEELAEGAPTCRWLIEGIKVDVMPTDEIVLGFTSPWYPSAILNARSHELPGGPAILLISAPDFIATKLAAFEGRGGGDYLASHDIEDLIAVVDGREELESEVRGVQEELRERLRRSLSELLDQRAFRVAIPGHLRPDSISQARQAVIVRRLERLAGRSG